MARLTGALASLLIVIAVAGCRAPAGSVPPPGSADPLTPLPAETLPMPSIRLPSAPAPETEKPVVGEFVRR